MHSTAAMAHTRTCTHPRTCHCHSHRHDDDDGNDNDNDNEGKGGGAGRHTPMYCPHPPSLSPCTHTHMASTSPISPTCPPLPLHSLCSTRATPIMRVAFFFPSFSFFFFAHTDS